MDCGGEAPAPGSIVDIVDDKRRFLARGYLNELSQISLRILSRDKDEKIDDAFIRRRVSEAVARRKVHFDFNDIQIARLIFSEADFLPGLIADRYGPLITVQSLSAGAERFLETAVDALMAETGVKSVFIKNDAEIRRREGLELYTKFIGIDIESPVKVTSDGIHYLIDFASGQKTGFFADQRRAYDVIRRYSKGGRVLDCFSYSGAFSMNALRHGAESAVMVDISETAIALAKETARLNGVYHKCAFFAENAFDHLKESYLTAKRGIMKKNEFYDFIVLDPPAFAKNKASVPKALSGYKELALRAASLLNKGGRVLTCTCSHHVGIEDFYRSQADAFSDAGVTAFTEAAGFQDERDHPILSCMDETLYLKFFLFQVR